MSVHSTGILALAETSGKTVYDGEVPDAASAPYVLVAIPPFLADAEPAVTGDGDVRGYFKVTNVGTSVDSCRVVQASTELVLHKKVPTVTGHLGYCERISTTPFDVDDSIDLPGTGKVVHCVDTYRYTATPKA